MTEVSASSLPARPPVGADSSAAERLSLGTIYTYSLPTVGVGFIGLLITLYLMKFSTDVLLIAPGAMGVLFGLSRIWDAISDPLAGYLSDRSSSRLGRRRSWMLASAIPLGAGVVMLWSPPLGLGELGLILWMALAFFVYETASTAFFIPYGAMGVELTSNYHERTRLFGYRHVIGAGGMIAAVLGFELLRRAEDQRSFAFGLSLLAGAVIAGLIIWAVVKLPERPEYQGRGATNIGSAFADVFRNPHARLLLFVFGIETFGAATIAMLAPYVMQYINKAPELTVYFVLLYFIPQFALTPIWIRLSRRFGKKRLWIFSMSLLTVGYTGNFFVGEGRIVLLLVLPFFIGVASGCGAVVAPSIKADVIDYDEYLTGERKEGAYLAIWNLVRKGAGGITAMLIGLVLQTVGFEPNVEQSETTQTAILVLFGLLPGTCYLIGTLLFLRFSFNEREHAEIRAVLDARHNDREEAPRG